MDACEKRILACIEAHRAQIIAFGKDIFAHPEAGYREQRTAEKVAQAFSQLGGSARESLRTGIALTGVRAEIGGPGPKIALLGELDAIGCASHPAADPASGMAHACGHHLQLCALLGAAMALSDPQVCALLGGSVALMAVPAEEYGEVEFKEHLSAQGLIRYAGGKSEWIRLGEFDDVDAALTHHVHYQPADQALILGSASSNGFVMKRIAIGGRAAHAAAAPHEGVNALSAASIGLTALGMIRETFRDGDAVRVHPILTRGGEIVNVVPAQAMLEAQVRANNLPAMLDAARKTDRAFRAGALAMGASLDILDLPGYLPMRHRAALPLQREVAEMLLPANAWRGVAPGEAHAASTDVGDLSHLLPVINFTTGGVAGALHSAAFRVTDEEIAYLLPAKVMALTAWRLLKDGARAARALIAAEEPPMRKAQYLAAMEAIRSNRHWEE